MVEKVRAINLDSENEECHSLSMWTKNFYSHLSRAHYPVHPPLQ